ncbi:ATP-binding cassette domain-containing protein [Candidatus Contubernalis alkaliaceticus]|uniref:ATP-binding cassette domain-containing protein n=1 Tax=Candidatus Contubernalis alkaliaceticus TaxID=338645 RepID=UPI001F4C4168|nr:ATP-binding cassette domain-containing protein [Candidatus Contubernalis alkalaceticus]UNC93271.1 ATP-binding cassette domain-containing protein [Candidatus Contubernalis alkalaceticus]
MDYKNFKITYLLDHYPFVKKFFEVTGLPLNRAEVSFKEYVKRLEPAFLEDLGMEKQEIIEKFDYFMMHMQTLKEGKPFSVSSITVLGGHDKEGNPECYDITLKKGEIFCIVGPTGSGKSRLLADIEWMAQGDTPTGRGILINGSVPDSEWRFSLEHKLVAQLSQNMNFVMDMTVYDFIKIHAESRMVTQLEEKVEEIITQANMLAGEEFYPDTPVTFLSGGQSRSLMIADTAFLSTSPIVLIDEIENAGIDRKKALELLIGNEKIVLIATHDPILALMGDKRLVLKNGAIHKVIETSAKEREQSMKLQKLDETLLQYRNLLRRGEMIEEVKI